MREREHVLEESGEIRVSCNSFIDLKDSQGRHLLLVNKGRLFRGSNVVLTPVGGGVEFTNQGRARVQAIIGSSLPLHLENGMDMRFVMPNNDTLKRKVIDWFVETRKRERDPKREVAEELVEEFSLLTQEEAKKISVQSKPQVISYEDSIERRGWLRGTSLIIAEVFPATIRDSAVIQKLHQAAKSIPSHVVKQLRDEYEEKLALTMREEEREKLLGEVDELFASGKVSSFVYWATDEEIRAGRTDTGIQIGRVAKVLLGE